MLFFKKFTVELHKASHSFHRKGQIFRWNTNAWASELQPEHLPLLRGPALWMGRGKIRRPRLSSTHYVSSYRPQSHPYFLTTESFPLIDHFSSKCSSSTLRVQGWFGEREQNNIDSQALASPVESDYLRVTTRIFTGTRNMNMKICIYM